MEPRPNNTIRNVAIACALVVVTVVGARILLQRNRGASEPSPVVIVKSGDQPSSGQSAQAPEAVARSSTDSAAVGSAPLEGCYTVTFKHRESDGHRDREACSAHENALSLSANEVLSAIPRKTNTKALCVRVDGVPVKYEHVKGTLKFGAVAGPGSVVSVQACIGKAACKFNCVIPKDEFMDAIGAAEGDDQGRAPASAKWDANDKEEDKDATAGLDDELSGAGVAAHKLPVFRDWLVVGHSPTCELAKEGS